MVEAVFLTPWPWWAAGPAIGLVVVLLAWVAGKPLGASTGYGVACALGSRLPFFQAGEYRERWRLGFILGLPVGGLLASLPGGGVAPTLAYGSLDAWLGGSLPAKGALLFAGGLLIGAGARWAGGCPSGHSIVGMAQGAPSSVVATVGFMVGGVAVFNLLRALLGA
jgi:uncharacterized membrane protein YedE/YeeE